MMNLEQLYFKITPTYTKSENAYEMSNFQVTHHQMDVNISMAYETMSESVGGPSEDEMRAYLSKQFSREIYGEIEQKVLCLIPVIESMNLGSASHLKAMEILEEIQDLCYE